MVAIRATLGRLLGGLLATYCARFDDQTLDPMEKGLKPYCCSQPSVVGEYSQASMPAFATRTSSRGTSFSTLSQNSFTDSNLAKSTRRSSTFSRPVAALISIRRVDFRPCGGYSAVELTFNCFLPLGLVSASEDQSLGIHRREVLCRLKTYSSVGPSDQNDLAGKIGGDEGDRSGQLLPQCCENGKLGHGRGDAEQTTLHP